MSNFPAYMEGKGYIKPIPGSTWHPPDCLCWQDQRQRVIKKFKSKCFFCGDYSKKFEVHHTTYKFKRGSNEEFKTLLLLCQSCHRNFHKKHKYNRKLKCFVKRKNTFL